MALYFEDVEIGRTEEGPEFPAEKSAMLQYAAEIDPYPIHVDEEFARQSPIGGIIAPFGYTYVVTFLPVDARSTTRSGPPGCVLRRVGVAREVRGSSSTRGPSS